MGSQSETWPSDFHFLKDKEDEKNSEQAWAFLVVGFFFLFTLAAPNSACL